MPFTLLSTSMTSSRPLRRVKNDEGIIERAPAHESNGSNFNDVLFQLAVYLLRVEQIVERIVEGPQIGINFFLQGTRQKTQALAGFDRGAGKNDPVHLLSDQGRDRHRHREVGLSR